MEGVHLRRRQEMGKTGFTVVELLVVLAVIATTAAIAAPSVGRWIANYRVKTAARQMMTDLLSARMTAVSRKAPCLVKVDCVNNQYTIQQNGATLGIPRQLNVAIIGNGTNPYYAPGVVLGTSAVPAVATWTVTFDTLGNATFSPTNIQTATFTQNTLEWSVSVSPAGGVSITNVGANLAL